MKVSLDKLLSSQSRVHGICVQLLWTELVALWVSPLTHVAVGCLFCILLVPVKWALVGRLSPAKLKGGGHSRLFRLRLHLWRSLLELPYIKTTWMWTATEVFNTWLRALGAKVGRQAWLSEKLRLSEHDLFEVSGPMFVTRAACACDGRWLMAT